MPRADTRTDRPMEAASMKKSITQALALIIATGIGAAAYDTRMPFSAARLATSGFAADEPLNVTRTT